MRLPIEEVPHLQKEIMRFGIRYARPVVVATQMLESMTHAQVPTRGEVTDVANAVLDGASAVMLSGEAAIGDDSVGSVITMDRIVRRAERSFPHAERGPMPILAITRSASTARQLCSSWGAGDLPVLGQRH
ncbi:MAG TPA: pyruvate kinase [Acidimicrobiales bacterium]|nr:pyruvate kinase [Acidimicrobiales bacterium]